MPDEPQTWVLLILYLLGSAYLSASETAFMTANRFKIKAKAEEGSFSARLAAWVIVRLENSIVTITIFNNIVNTLFTSLMTVIFVNKLGGNTAELFSTLVAVPVVFLFAEMVPKLIAKRFNEQFSLFSGYILAPLIIIAYPISMIFRGITWLIKKIFRSTDDNIFSTSDFENIIESIEEHGDINEDASDLIISTLEFSETIVKDVLTPKNQIIAFDLNKYNSRNFTEAILKTSFSRIPIYDGNIDRIVGVVVIREYVKQVQKNANVPLKKVMSKPYFVNYKINLTKMLDGFKRHNTHIAFVLDDNKKLIGMVTMEDVLEELVGQIAEVSTNVKEVNSNG